MSTPAAPVILDPNAHVSRHLARRTAELIGQVTVQSVDGIDGRHYRAFKAAGVRMPQPSLVRGTVGGHRMQIERNPAGQAEGRCDCRAATYGLRCGHLLALAVHAVVLGWQA